MAFLINITNMCQLFHCLPYPGGLLSQPPQMVAAMQAVIEAQHTARERERQEEEHAQKVAAGKIEMQRQLGQRVRGA